MYCSLAVCSTAKSCHPFHVLQVPGTKCLMWQVANILLDYCLSDLDVTDSTAVAELQQLPLCALADGSLQPFWSSNSELRYILTADERTLLSGEKSLGLILHWQVKPDSDSMPL